MSVLWVLSTVVLGVATFLPWGTSGARARSSYELTGVADRLGVLPGPLLRTIAATWPIAPVVLGIGVLAALADRRRIGALLVLVVAVTALGLAVAVDRSPLRLGTGWVIAAIAGVATVATSFVLLLQPRRHRADGRI